MIQSNTSRHARMTQISIPALVLSLAAPSAITMIVIALYTLADAYFVSSLGTAAGAAVGVVFAVHVLLQAVGYTLGMGGGSLLSRALGRKDEKQASEYATVALLFGAACGILITVLSLLFRHRLLLLLGATESIYQFALDYAIPLFWSALPTCLSFVLGQLLRAEGKAVYSMVGQGAGCLANILLDPLLIRNVGLGIAGASIATLISQCLSCLLLFSAYWNGKTRIRLLSGFRPSILSRIGTIVVTGLPSLLRQGLSGMATILLNHAAALHGDAAVTALSIVNRLFLFVFSICLGFGQGMMPVVGYNVGSGNAERAKRAYWFALWGSTVSMALISIPLLIWAPKWIGFFRADPDVIAIGARALRLQALVLFSHGLVTCTILFLQAMGRALPATTLAAARQGIFFLPLILALPRRFSLQGLILTQPLADAATLLFALPFAFFAFRNVWKGDVKGEGS